MIRFARPICYAALLVGGFAVVAVAVDEVLFQDNFDSGLSGANWVALLSNGGAPTDTAADFAFDYGSLGIPAAPRSNGTTIGVGFTVNREANVFQGISASPIDQHFTGDFRIRFDAWVNFVGAFPDGGTGSTQMASFGWGTTGTLVQWAASNHSMIFAASGDGGTATDYRVYRVGGGAPLAPDLNPGVYAAGNLTGSPDSRNSNDPYYSSLGSKSAPAAQLALFPNQTGITAPGTFGMAWHDVTIDKVGDVFTWTVDGLLMATVPLNGASPSGDNIFFGMFDINNPSSSEPNNFLNTAIYDNIVVTSVPEPSSLAFLGLVGGIALLRRPRRAVRSESQEEHGR
jgi:hypothetical protein